ncbi:PEP-CTERM sorting domain-containing protein [Muricoccus nepalensis]|uniref:PEP-CTERM sorting domain-containing protein n=1 Tax=Muricoccus nepalensis TaxID=1854500 RepID=UPI0019D574F8|nr:PEP-CTERM sorting domain-containing protein [Roseomonas nepalensis]
MRIAAAAVAAVLALGVIADAKAAVVYTFNTISTTSPFPERGTLPFSATLDLKEAQVATGAFTYSTPLGMGSSYSGSGDVSGFNALTLMNATFVTGFSPGTLSIGLLFDAAGAISSTRITFFGIDYTAFIDGTGTAASGTLYSDRPECNPFPGTTPCSIAGFWSNTPFVAPVTAVPEPMSLALFGIGLAGLGVVRRKRAA